MESNCLDRPRIFKRHGGWQLRSEPGVCKLGDVTKAMAFIHRLNRQALDGTAFERGAEPMDGRAPGGSL